MKLKIILPITAIIALSGAFFYVRHDSTPAYAPTSQPIPGFSKTPGPSGFVTVTKTPVTSSVTPTPRPTPRPGSRIVQSVPFTAQAPFGEWSDQRQQDGCEEASALMAVSWARGQTFTLEQAKQKILEISDWEQDKYNNYHDTSASDTVERIYKGYFKFNDVKLVYDVFHEEILKELEAGNLVVIPADGRKLGNPNFTPPGPEHHMLVIIGYDYSTDEFITNDPGTRQGKDYRYTSHVIDSSLRDYPTGNHLDLEHYRTAMIVVSK